MPEGEDDHLEMGLFYAGHFGERPGTSAWVHQNDDGVASLTPPSDLLPSLLVDVAIDDGLGDGEPLKPGKLPFHH